jgi:hypothetical protein
MVPSSSPLKKVIGSFPDALMAWIAAWRSTVRLFGVPFFDRQSFVFSAGHPA